MRPPIVVTYIFVVTQVKFCDAKSILKLNLVTGSRQFVIVFENCLTEPFAIFGWRPQSQGWGCHQHQAQL